MGKFNARKPELEKRFAYFEIESIDNPCLVVIAVNPEEYYKHFENFSCNEKLARSIKGTPGMNFENFAKRITTANQIENFDNPKNKYCEQQRCSIQGREMTKTAVMKTKFSQTNDKRFYFLNGITSLPVSHPLLKDLTDYKEQKDEKIEKYFLEEKMC